MTTRNLAAAALIGAWVVLTTGCGGSSSSPRPTQASGHAVGGTVTGLLGTLVLANNGSDALTVGADGAFVFATAVPEGGAYSVTVQNQPSAQTCVVTNGSGTMGGANVTNVSLTCSNSTTLAISVSNIALSVTGLTEYGVSGTPSSGAARSITVTNTGSNPAINVAVSAPTWPAGTTSSTTCGSTLTASSSCTITITPGSTASSDGTIPCSEGTAPLPGTIQVAGDNTNTVSSNAEVLSYGCIYQGGYVYAFDDTTPTSASVGGKVAATVDQAAPYPNGIVWSSNGSGGTGLTDTSYDAIPGVDETSTRSSGSPTYASFSAGFASTYTNPNPFSAASFASCDGAFDGSCNTNNIVAFYNQFMTNNTTAYGGPSPFTASPGPTNTTDYAAGLCKATINGHSDWYLPAQCEMGYGSTPCGTAVVPALQNMQSSLVEFNGLNLLAGVYWSSTQATPSSVSLAWVHQFAFGGFGTMSFFAKSIQAGVRCSRALVP